MTKREQLQAEIIEKQKELISKLNSFAKFLHNAIEIGIESIDAWQEVFDVKLSRIKQLESELSALTAELEKEGEESISAPCPHFEECRNGGKNKYCDVETFTQIDCFMTNNRQ